MFFSKKLKKFSNIRHAFFSKKNGVSKGIYESLNCGPGSKDKLKNVSKNLEIVCNAIGCKKNSLITLRQIHSNKVIYFQNHKKIKKKLSGDAIITNMNKIAIGILTADCVPILFYDPKKKIIGCVHSGWKGALKGIIKNTIKKFVKLGCNPHDLVAVVGPCIGKDSYEVGIDFYKKFLKENVKNSNFFIKTKKGKYVFDLRNYVNKKLLDLNVKTIDNIKCDTFSDENNFYSYRRSLINKEKDYGRCISVILMT